MTVSGLFFFFFNAWFSLLTEQTKIADKGAKNEGEKTGNKHNFQVLSFKTA